MSLARENEAVMSASFFLQPHISYFARVDYRENNAPFGIYQSDRLMGMYILGKTGTGKSNLLKTLIYQDSMHGRGYCVFDVNGDLVREVLADIPTNRQKDIVYLDCSNPSLSWGYNPLKKVSYHKRALIASSILESLKKIWGQTSWGLRIEYILRNVLLTLLDQPSAHFGHVPKLLRDEEFRKDCLKHIVNKHVKQFWIHEFPKYSKNDLLPVLNKIGSFLSIPMIHKILVENKQQISLREIMDKKRILLINVSKGSLGSDGGHLLASLLLSSLSSAGFSRVNIDIKTRVPFYIYLDEFQNYTSDTLPLMISELRKFGLGFVFAHQYLHQLNTDIRHAILGNIGTLICFKLGLSDAKYMTGEFYPVFTASDFTSLDHFHIYVKLLIGGKSSQGFSAKTLHISEIQP